MTFLLQLRDERREQILVEKGFYLSFLPYGETWNASRLDKYLTNMRKNILDKHKNQVDSQLEFRVNFKKSLFIILY